MSSNICVLETGWVQVGDPGKRIFLPLVEEFLTVGVGPRRNCICGNGSAPLEDPLFWCQSDSWEQADDTKWVISAELNTEVSYKVRAGGSGRQLSAAADSARYFPAPSTLTSFLLVV